jgi:hypothetical protein
MSITDLVEMAVIADLADEPELAAFLPKPRDNDTRLAGDDEPGEDEATLTLSVSAIDEGEFYRGSGIKRVALTVEIRHNAVAEEADRSQLDSVAELVDDRLQPSTAIEGVVGREAAFSSDVLKVFGIIATTPEPRENEDLIRIRRITRVFVAAQLA